MTARVERPGAGAALGDHERRVRALERPRTPRSVETGYPTIQHLPLFSTRGNSDQSVDFAQDPVALDAACVHGARFVFPGSDGAYFNFHLRVGPHGAIHALEIRHTMGPDHGILKFDWATPTEDYDDGSDPDPSALLQGAATEGLAYVTYPNPGPGGVGEIDGYALAPDKNVLNGGIQGVRSEFRVTGQPGDPLTQFAAASPWTYDADGGPGVWNLRLKVDGQNGSSVGFEFGLVEVTLQREDHLGF